MTGATVNRVTAGHDDEAPPRGTAIVRPLRHVRAVRERHAAQFADPSEAAASRAQPAHGPGHWGRARPLRSPTA